MLHANASVDVLDVDLVNMDPVYHWWLVQQFLLVQPWNNGTFKLDASRAAVKPVGPRPSGVAGRGPPKEPTWTPSAAAPGAKKGSVPPSMLHNCHWWFTNACVNLWTSSDVWMFIVLLCATSLCVGKLGS